MKTHRLILLTCVIFTMGINNSHAQQLTEIEAMNILSKWEGDWQGNAVMNKSIWIPKEIEMEGFTTSELILEGKYLEIFNENLRSETKMLIRYDQASKSFNRWEFKSDGSTSFWVGKWKRFNQKMTWSFIDFSNSGISGKITERFESDEKIKAKVFMKDIKGNVLLEIESVATKTK
ncbi:MAG: hypothetical protein P8I82_05820 [Flavobacteriales bacterium]|nr:hypothetical protein [Flavobacteriales bacterium]